MARVGARLRAAWKAHVTTIGILETAANGTVSASLDDAHVVISSPAVAVAGALAGHPSTAVLEPENSRELAPRCPRHVPCWSRPMEETVHAPRACLVGGTLHGDGDRGGRCPNPEATPEGTPETPRQVRREEHPRSDA